MTFGIVACNENAKAKKLPEYPQQEFNLSGYWAPYEISEESFKKYQDVGFNTLLMVNHSLDRNSENQFYLGSKRTMDVLKICKKVGLKAILNYNDWMAEMCEEEGKDYYGEIPFSKFDIYGDYKDIITGIHIVDEPKDFHIPIYGNPTLIKDFKKVYPNADYVVNLLPICGAKSYGFDSYPHMFEVYDKTFMSNFETPYISIDLYPFQTRYNAFKYLCENHNAVATKAKETGAKTTFIMQASTGIEFEESLSEGDMRYQVNFALAFGTDNLQYYCYEVPLERDYNYCILNADGTPSEIYDYVKNINREIQSYASAYLAYDWDQAIGVSGTEENTFYMSTIEYDENYDRRNLANVKHFVSAQGTQDLVISRFESEEYGEAYMLVNFAEDNGKVNAVDVAFKDCDAVAIYGGVGYSGTPKIVTLDEEGKMSFEFVYGDGVFVVPLAK